MTVAGVVVAVKDGMIWDLVEIGTDQEICRTCGTIAAENHQCSLIEEDPQENGPKAEGMFL